MRARRSRRATGSRVSRIVEPAAAVATSDFDPASVAPGAPACDPSGSSPRPSGPLSTLTRSTSPSWIPAGSHASGSVRVVGAGGACGGADSDVASDSAGEDSAGEDSAGEDRAAAVSPSSTSRIAHAPSMRRSTTRRWAGPGRPGPFSPPASAVCPGSDSDSGLGEVVPVVSVMSGVACWGEGGAAPSPLDRRGRGPRQGEVPLGGHRRCYAVTSTGCKCHRP